MSASETETLLRQAVDGLSYQSESDAPWEAFSWPTAKGEPAAEAVARQAKLKISKPATVQTLDEFFGPLTQEQDWFGDEEKAVAAKYRALLDLVKKRLKTPKVVRIGGRQVAVFVVGQAPEGGWAGVRTTAVET